MTNSYNSFSEIDKRLRILRLQREVHKESLKLNINRAKTNLNPVEIIESTGQRWKQSLIDFALSKGLQVLHKLRRKELSK